MDRLAGMAVSQLVKHSNPEVWDDKGMLKKGDGEKGRVIMKGGGVADEEETDDESDEEDEEGGRGGGGAARTKAEAGRRGKAKDQSETKGDSEKEEEDDEEDDEGGGGRRKKNQRMCSLNGGSLFGGGGIKELWIAAMCVPPQDTPNTERGEQDDGRRGVDRGGGVPGWGETLTSLSWTKYQFKLKSEGARAGRSLQRMSASVVPGLVEGGRNIGQAAEHIGKVGLLLKP